MLGGPGKSARRPGVAQAAAALALGLASCGLDQVEVLLDDQVSIPATTIGSPFQPTYPQLQGLAFASRQELQNNDVKPEDIDAIFVLGARLEGTEPQKDNLGAILSRASFDVESPGLERRLLASKDPMPDGPSVELDFDPMFDLKPYGTAPSMSIHTDLGLKEPRAFPTTVKVTFTLLVDVNLGGI